MITVGDKVEIVFSIHKELIGRKAEITEVIKPIGQEPYYSLDIIAGHWTGDKLKKI